MKSLRFLSVQDNRLTGLPYSLGFLESLRVLKLGNNPLNSTLRTLMDGHDNSISPTSSNVIDNQKDSIITEKIKIYLRSEATTLESPADSSGESPLDTPRPLKRASTTLRFPVVPTSGRESISDQRSPGFFKPPVPVRSHYRVPSGQNTVFPKPGFHRADIAPLLISNERNRSSSESLVQVAQNPRNKRMGIMSKQPNSLHPLSESISNRNSFHLRGTSHGPAPKDRRHKPFRSGLGSGSSQSDSPTDDRSRGVFIHRLSSVPEQRSETPPGSSNVIEAARGLLYGLNLINPIVESLLSLTGDGTTKRSSLERVYFNASSHINKLDQELAIFDSLGVQNKKRKKRTIDAIRNASKTCMVVYKQVITSILLSGRLLVEKADQRYIRTLHMLMFYSGVEISNANQTLHKPINPSEATRSQKATGPARTAPPKLTLLPSATVRKDSARPAFSGPPRFRSDTLNLIRSQQGQTKPPAAPQSAVPLHMNGRSRSNSRSAAYGYPDFSSLANTPHSGESFLIPGTPASTGFDGRVSASHSNSSSQKEDSIFEKIYFGLNNAVASGDAALSELLLVLNRSRDEATRYGNKSLSELWTRLVAGTRQCMDRCEELRTCLQDVKFKDPDIRNSSEFWLHVARYSKAIYGFGNDIRREMALNHEAFSRINPQGLLKPGYITLKTLTADIRNSPWLPLFEGRKPPATATPGSASGWPGDGSSGSTITQGQLSTQRPPNGNHHKQGDSGSSSHILPTTPLSAALGPAAQATMPTSATSVSSAGTLFDRSFQGNVFQRAEHLMIQQPNLRNGRPWDNSRSSSVSQAIGSS